MIIDFHTHIFPPYLREHREELLTRDRILADMYSSPRAKMVSAEELVAAMDETGVDVSVVLGIGWDDPELCREANDYVIESVRRFPTRLKGFCTVNPRWGIAAIAEVVRCAGAGLVGIGELHPDAQRFDLGDEAAMAPLVDVAMKLGMPILTHASEPVGHLYAGKGSVTPDVLCRFIDNFSDVTLICAHWGGGLPFYTLMPEVARSLQNVFFDTAASPLLYRQEIFPVVVGLVGADRVLLGSDYPVVGQGRLIHQVADSPLSDDAKEAILHGNAAKLLGMTLWNKSDPS